MLGKKSVCAIVIIASMLMSGILVFLPNAAQAASWLVTTDSDFSPGDFYVGTGFDTTLHDVGVAAYVQTIKGQLAWIQKFPATNTGPRDKFGFANDSAESRFILFGGRDGISQARNDTWEYDYSAGNWIKICNDNTPACAPPKRTSPSMAYDNNSKVAVLYGGIAADYVNNLEDTWEYHVSNNTWINRTSPTRPRGLWAHSMVYDAKDKKVILVGRGASAMEVWVYDASTHVWVQRTPAGGPSQRSGFAMAYSYQASHQRIVLFGGAEVMTVYNDTWEYNYASNSWTKMNPAIFPSERSGASMTYSFRPGFEGIYLWGGNSFTSDTWRYWWDNGTAAWAPYPTATAPAPRQQYGLAYDIGYNAMIVYGGAPPSGPRFNDTWFLESGYKSWGKYSSRFFDTGFANTTWKNIFWNQTPANVPPNTVIKLQVDYSNTCNNADTYNFRGPDGTVGTYYDTPGQQLNIAGYECLRWQAHLWTTDPAVAPKLEDVNIVYVTCGSTTPPEVLSWSPTLAGNPTNSYVYVNFS